MHRWAGWRCGRSFSRSSFGACRKRLADLKPTHIADLRNGLNKNLVLVARTIVQPAKLSVFIESVIEDDVGSFAKLRIQNMPLLDERDVQCIDAMFPQGHFFAIKQPFAHSAAAASTSKLSAFRTIQVDHPSDIVLLHIRVAF